MFTNSSIYHSIRFLNFFHRIFFLFFSFIYCVRFMLCSPNCHFFFCFSIGLFCIFSRFKFLFQFFHSFHSNCFLFVFFFFSFSIQFTHNSFHSQTIFVCSVLHHLFDVPSSQLQLFSHTKQSHVFFSAFYFSRQLFGIYFFVGFEEKWYDTFSNWKTFSLVSFALWLFLPVNLLQHFYHLTIDCFIVRHEFCVFGFCLISFELLPLNSM